MSEGRVREKAAVMFASRLMTDNGNAVTEPGLQARYSFKIITRAGEDSLPCEVWKYIW